MQGTLEVLHEDGFIVFRGVLSDQEVQQGASCISDSGERVHYANMEQFIRNAMFKRVKESLGLSEKLDFVKYRVSDNNNSADAAAFHRDLIFMGDTSSIISPCFTCLTYFDKTTLEVIPGSHVRNYSLLDIPNLYAKIMKLTIHPGDILLFFSTLLHRGVFTEGIKHRRLIQVFEVFTSSNIRDIFTPLIVHVPGNETYSDWMISASKGTGPIISLINMYGFFNAATGYGWRSRPLAKCGLQKSHLFFSSEGLRARIEVVPDTWQPINKYIINRNITVHDISPKCQRIYKYYVFNRQFYQYTIILALFVTTLVICIIVGYKAISPRRSNGY